MFLHRDSEYSISLLMQSVGRGVGGVLLGGVVGIAVDDLDTDLLGEGQLNSLAVGGAQLGDTLLSGLCRVLNLRNSDALLLGQVLAGDPGQRDGLVDTGLDGLRVGDLDLWLHNCDNRYIVAGLLGDLLAVIVAIAIAVLSRLAHGHHLGLTLLLEGDINSLGSGGLSLGLVGVGAHLIVNLLNGLSAYGAGDFVALLLVDNLLDGQLNLFAVGLKSRGAHFGILNNVLDCAVVLGVLITVVGLVVSV